MSGAALAWDLVDGKFFTAGQLPKNEEEFQRFYDTLQGIFLLFFIDSELTRCE